MTRLFRMSAIICIILTAGVLNSSAQEAGKLFCREIGQPEGLSSDKVTALVQDDMGRLWVGTHKGVNCFDSQKASIPWLFRNNRITSLFRLPGRMIICSVTGMADYSLKTGQWHHIKLDGEEIPNVVSGFTDGEELVFVTNSGIFVYDGKGDPVLSSNNSRGVAHISKDRYGDIWESSQRRIYKVEKESLKTTEFDLPELGPNQSVTGLYCESSGYVWAWSSAGDLYRYSRTGGKFVKEALIDANGGRIVTDNITCIKENAIGQLLIGYHDGIVSFDKSDRVASRLEYSNPSFDRLHTVTALECSEGGYIFAGSFFNGVFILSPAAYNIALTRLNRPSEEGNTTTVANNIYEFEDESLIVGTNNNSLVYLDKEGRYLDHYGEGRLPAPQDVQTVTADAEGNIWAGLQYAGLYRIDKDGTAEVAIPMKGRFSGACITDIIQVGHDSLYVATEHGIDMLRPSSMEVHPAIVAKGECLYFGVFRTGSNICFVNYYSIFVIDKAGSWKKEVAFESKEGSTFRSGCAGPDGSLILGTDNGEILSFNPMDDSFRVLNNSTLINSEISNLIIDKSGNLWASSGNRMAVFSIDGKCLQEYSLASILERRLFNIRSSWLCHNGDIIFGTTDGFVRFAPDKLIETNQYKKSLHISDVFANGVPISTWLDNGSAHIGDDGELILSHNLSSVTISCSVIDYSPFNSGSNYVQVRVDPVSRMWEKAPSDMTIRSPVLNAGKYFVQWRLCSAGGEVLSTDTIAIRIKPHWMVSPLMIAIYVCIALLASCLAWIYYRREKRRREEQFRIEESRRINEHFNTRRMELLVNMGNEFKAPISIVSTILSSGDISSQDLVRNNVTKMRFLVDQMLDLEKFGLKQSDESSAELYDFALFVKKLCAKFVPQLEKNRIHLGMEGCNSELPAMFDAGKMELIICNLLKHMSKVAQSDSSATLSLKNQSGKITLKLRCKVKPSIDAAGEIGLNIANCLCELSGYRLEESSDKGDFEICKVLTIPKAENGSSEMSGLEDYGFDITERIADSVSDEGFSPSEFRDSEGHRKYRMLVVDTDDDHIELIKRSLKQDMHVRSAKSGEEALQKLASGAFDIVLSEIDIPGMSGYDLCRAVKSNESGHTAPVILMNYGMTEQKRLMALAANADQTIEKPVPLPSLFLMIRNLLKSDEEIRNKLMEIRGLDLSSQKMNRSDDKMVEKAIAYIKANLASNISIGGLSEALGVSRSRLYDDFNRVTKMPPGDFILKIKMQEACSMLESTNLTASEISYKLGYCNPNHFTRQFKSVFGKTPIAWRREKTESR